MLIKTVLCGVVWFVVAGCSNGWETTKSLDEGAINPLKMATNHDFQRKSKIANTYTVACFSIFDVHIVKNVSQSIDTPPFFWCTEQCLFNIFESQCILKTRLNYSFKTKNYAHENSFVWWCTAIWRVFSTQIVWVNSEFFYCAGIRIDTDNFVLRAIHLFDSARSVEQTPQPHQKKLAIFSKMSCKKEIEFS